ncbi:condensation domain-containing protein [Micromonospora sp. BRA006-A]|nr:condensation domain-containing protein [Micromonospora sp. BRA006-A]
MTESRHDVTPVDDVYTVPASYAQERVWFTAQLSPGQPLFTMTDAVTLPAGAGPEQALAALRAVTDRHEALRTTLRLHDGRLYQDIHPTVPVELPVTDLSALPGPGGTPPAPGSSPSTQVSTCRWTRPRCGGPGCCGSARTPGGCCSPGTTSSSTARPCSTCAPS